MAQRRLSVSLPVNRTEVTVASKYSLEYIDVNKDLGLLIADINQVLSSNATLSKGIVVVGDVGCGKTALLSATASTMWSTYTDANPSPFISFYISIAHPFADWAEVVSSVMLQISAGLQIPQDMFAPGVDIAWRRDVADVGSDKAICSFRGAWLREAARIRPLVIFIDGIDDLDCKGTLSIEDPLHWLPQTLPPNVCMVVSCRSDSIYHSRLVSSTAHNWREFKIQWSDMNQSKTWIPLCESYLSRIGIVERYAISIIVAGVVNATKYWPNGYLRLLSAFRTLLLCPNEDDENDEDEDPVAPKSPHSSLEKFQYRIDALMSVVTQQNKWASLKSNAQYDLSFCYRKDIYFIGDPIFRRVVQHRYFNTAQTQLSFHERLAEYLTPFVPQNVNTELSFQFFMMGILATGGIRKLSKDPSNEISITVSEATRRFISLTDPSCSFRKSMIPPKLLDRSIELSGLSVTHATSWSNGTWFRALALRAKGTLFYRMTDWTAAEASIRLALQDFRFLFGISPVTPFENIEVAVTSFWLAKCLHSNPVTSNTHMNEIIKLLTFCKNTFTDIKVMKKSAIFQACKTLLDKLDVNTGDGAGVGAGVDNKTNVMEIPHPPPMSEMPPQPEKHLSSLKPFTGTITSDPPLPSTRLHGDRDALRPPAVQLHPSLTSLPKQMLSLFPFGGADNANFNVLTKTTLTLTYENNLFEISTLDQLLPPVPSAMSLVWNEGLLLKNNGDYVNANIKFSLVEKELLTEVSNNVSQKSNNNNNNNNNSNNGNNSNNNSNDTNLEITIRNVAMVYCQLAAMATQQKDFASVVEFYGQAYRTLLFFGLDSSFEAAIVTDMYANAKLNTINITGNSSSNNIIFTLKCRAIHTLDKTAGISHPLTLSAVASAVIIGQSLQLLDAIELFLRQRMTSQCNAFGYLHRGLIPILETLATWYSPDDGPPHRPNLMYYIFTLTHLIDIYSEIGGYNDKVKQLTERRDNLRRRESLSVSVPLRTYRAELSSFNHPSQYKTISSLMRRFPDPLHSLVLKRKQSKDIKELTISSENAIDDVFDVLMDTFLLGGSITDSRERLRAATNTGNNVRTAIAHLYLAAALDRDRFRTDAMNELECAVNLLPEINDSKSTVILRLLLARIYTYQSELLLENAEVSAAGISVEHARVYLEKLSKSQGASSPALINITELVFYYRALVLYESGLYKEAISLTPFIQNKSIIYFLALDLHAKSLLKLSDVMTARSILRSCINEINSTDIAPVELQASAFITLASLELELGLSGNAESLSQEAVSIIQSERVSYPKFNYIVSSALRVHAMALMTHNLDEAMSACSKGVDVLDAMPIRLIIDDEQLVRCLELLGSLHCRKGDTTTGASIIDRAFTIVISNKNICDIDNIFRLTKSVVIVHETNGDINLAYERAVQGSKEFSTVARSNDPRDRELKMLVKTVRQRSDKLKSKYNDQNGVLLDSAPKKFASKIIFPPIEPTKSEASLFPPYKNNVNSEIPSIQLQQPSNEIKTSSNKVKEISDPEKMKDDDGDSVLDVLDNPSLDLPNVTSERVIENILNIARDKCKSNDWLPAKHAYADALRLSVARYGRNHRNICLILKELATVFKALSQPNRSMAALARAVAILESETSSHDTLNDTIDNLGNVILELDRREDATIERKDHLTNNNPKQSVSFKDNDPTNTLFHLSPPKYSNNDAIFLSPSLQRTRSIAPAPRPHSGLSTVEDDIQLPLSVMVGSDGRVHSPDKTLLLLASMSRSREVGLSVGDRIGQALSGVYGPSPDDLDNARHHSLPPDIANHRQRGKSPFDGEETQGRAGSPFSAFHGFGIASTSNISQKRRKRISESSTECSSMSSSSSSSQLSCSNASLNSCETSSSNDIELKKHIEERSHEMVVSQMEMQAKEREANGSYDLAASLHRVRLDMIKHKINEQRDSKISRLRHIISNLEPNDPRIPELKAAFVSDMSSSWLELLPCLTSLSRLLQVTGDVTGAEEAASEALDIVTTAKGNEHPDTARCMLNLAGVLHKRGLYDDSADLFEGGIRMLRECQGSSHPSVGVGLHNYCVALQEIGAYDNAYDLACESYEIMRDAFGDHHSETISPGMAVASALMSLERWNEAIKALEVVMEVASMIRHAGDPLVISIISSLADCYRHLNRPEETIALINRLIPLVEVENGSSHEDVIAAYSILGEMYYKIGRLDESVVIFQKILDIYDDDERRSQASGDESAAPSARGNRLVYRIPHYLVTLLQLGAVYSAQEREGEVLAVYDRLLSIVRQMKFNELMYNGRDVKSIILTEIVKWITILSELRSEEYMVNAFGRHGEGHLARCVSMLNIEHDGEIHLETVKLLLKMGRSCVVHGRIEEGEALIYKCRRYVDPNDEFLLDCDNLIARAKRGEDLTAEINLIDDQVLSPATKCTPSFRRAVSSIGGENTFCYNSLGSISAMASDADGGELEDVAASVLEHNISRDRDLNFDAEIAFKSGDYDKALSMFMRVLGLRETAYGENHEKVATVVNNIAIIYKEKNQLHDAISYAERGFKILEDKFGTDSPVLVTTLENCGSLYIAVGDMQRALHVTKQLFSIVDQEYGDKHATTAVVANNLGALFELVNDVDSACRLYSHASRVLFELDASNQHGNNHLHKFETLKAMNNWASLLINADDTQYAITVLDGCVKYLTVYSIERRAAQPYPLIDPQTIVFINNVAKLLQKINSLPNAGFHRSNSLGSIGGALVAPMPSSELDIRQRTLNLCKNIIHKWNKDIMHHVCTATNRKIERSSIESSGNRFELESFDEIVSKHPIDAPHLTDNEISSLSLIMSFVLDGCSAIEGFSSDNSYHISREYCEMFRQTLKLSLLGQVSISNPSLRVHLGLADLYERVGLCLASIRNYSEALKEMSFALDIRRQLLGEIDISVVRTLVYMAKYAELLGNHSDALMYLQQGTDAQEISVFRDHPELSKMLKGLAYLYADLGDDSKVMSLLQKATAIQEKIVGQSHASVGSNLLHLARLKYESGDLENAEKDYVRALEITRLSMGESHSDVAAILNNLAVIQKAQNNLNEAIPFAERALAIYGGENVDSVPCRDNLAQMYIVQERYTSAAGLLSHNLTIAQRVLGSQHVEVAEREYNLSVLYMAMSYLPEAIALALRALSTIETTLGPSHEEVAAICLSLADMYMDQGSLSKAEPLRQRAAKILSSASSSGTNNTSTKSTTKQSSLQSGKSVGHGNADRGAIKLIDDAIGDIEHTIKPMIPKSGLRLSSGNVGGTSTTMVNGMALLGLDRDTDITSYQKVNDSGVNVKSNESSPNHQIVKDSNENGDKIDGLLATASAGIFGDPSPGSFVSGGIIIDGRLRTYREKLAMAMSSLRNRRDSDFASPFVSAIALMVSTFGADDPHVKTAFDDISKELKSQNREPRIIKVLCEVRRALEIDSSIGSDHPVMAIMLSTLANRYCETGDWDEARSLLLRCLVIRDKCGTMSRPAGIAVWRSLSIVYKSLGYFIASAEVCEKALIAAEKIYGITAVETIALSRELYDILDQYPTSVRTRKHLSKMYDLRVRMFDVAAFELSKHEGSGVTVILDSRGIADHGVTFARSLLSSTQVISANCHPGTVVMELDVHYVELGCLSLELGLISVSEQYYQCSYEARARSLNKIMEADAAVTLARVVALNRNPLRAIELLHSAKSIYTQHSNKLDKDINIDILLASVNVLESRICSRIVRSEHADIKINLSKTISTAHSLAQMAIETITVTKGTECYEHASASNSYARALIALGKTNEADSVLMRAVEVVGRLIGASFGVPSINETFNQYNEKLIMADWSPLNVGAVIQQISGREQRMAAEPRLIIADLVTTLAYLRLKSCEQNIGIIHWTRCHEFILTVLVSALGPHHRRTIAVARRLLDVYSTLSKDVSFHAEFGESIYLCGKYCMTHIQVGEALEAVSDVFYEEAMYLKQNQWLSKVDLSQLISWGTTLCERAKVLKTLSIKLDKVEASNDDKSVNDIRISSNLRLGLLFEVQEDVNRAISCFKEASDSHIPSMALRYQILITLALDGIGRVLIKLNKADDAEVYFRRALDMREKLCGPSSASVAISHIALANLFHHKNDSDRALRFEKNASVTLSNLCGPFDRRLVPLFRSIANRLMEQRKYSEALLQWIKVLKIEESDFDFNSDVIAKILMEMIVASAGFGNIAAERKYRSLRIQILSKIEGVKNSVVREEIMTAPISAAKSAVVQAELRYGVAHPITATALGNLGARLLMDSDKDWCDMKEVYEIYNRALNIRTRHFGLCDLRVVEYQVVISDLLCNDGRDKDAIRMLTDAMATLNLQVDELSTERLPVLYRLADLEKRGDQHGKLRSINYINAAVNICESYYGKTSIEMAECLERKADLMLYMKSSDYVDLYASAFQISTIISGEKSGTTTRILFKFVRGLATIGKLDDALQKSRQLLSLIIDDAPLESNEVCPVLSTVASLYELTHHENSALEYIDAWIRRMKASCGADSFSCVSGYETKARLLEKLGKTSDAVNEWRAALLLRKLHQGSDHKDVTYTQRLINELFEGHVHRFKREKNCDIDIDFDRTKPNNVYVVVYNDMFDCDLDDIIDSIENDDAINVPSAAAPAVKQTVDTKPMTIGNKKDKQTSLAAALNELSDLLDSEDTDIVPVKLVSPPNKPSNTSSDSKLESIIAQSQSLIENGQLSNAINLLNNFIETSAAANDNSKEGFAIIRKEYSHALLQYANSLPSSENEEKKRIARQCIMLLFEASETIEKIYGTKSSRLSPIMELQAEAHSILSHPDQMEYYIQSAISCIETDQDVTFKHNLIRLYCVLGDVSHVTKTLEQAISFYNNAVSMVPASSSETLLDKEFLGDCIHAIAGYAALLRSNGQVVPAKKVFRQCSDLLINIDKKLDMTPRSQRLALEIMDTYSKQAEVFSDDSAETFACATRSLLIAEIAFGKDSAELSGPLTDLANAYVIQNNDSEALKLYRKALTLLRQFGVGNDVRLVAVHKNIGALHMRSLDYEAAKIAYVNALDLSTIWFGPESSEVADILVTLALLYNLSNDLMHASVLLNKNLDIVRKIYRSDAVKIETALVECAHISDKIFWNLASRAIDNSNNELSVEGQKCIDFCVEAITFMRRRPSGGSTHDDCVALIEKCVNIYVILSRSSEAIIMLDEIIKTGDPRMVNVSQREENIVLLRTLVSEVSLKTSGEAAAEMVLKIHIPAARAIIQKYPTSKQNIGIRSRFICVEAAVQTALKNFKGAINLLVTEISNFQKLGGIGQTHPCLVPMYIALVDLYHVTDDKSSEVDALSGAITSKRRELNSGRMDGWTYRDLKDISVATMIERLAALKEELGNIPDAISLFEMTIEAMADQSGRNSITFAQSLVYIGGLYESVGDVRRAEEVLMEAMNIFIQKNGPRCDEVIELRDSLLQLFDSKSMTEASDRFTLKYRERGVPFPT